MKKLCIYCFELKKIASLFLVLPLLSLSVASCGDFNAQGGLWAVLLSELLNQSEEEPVSESVPWEDPEGSDCYSYRKRITFDDAHDFLLEGHTVSFTMDTTATNSVSSTTGNDVRILWQPWSGEAVELDRLGDYNGSTWNSSSTIILFRLQSDLEASATFDADGEYYVYYGCSSASSAPETEAHVFYFADFFNRASLETADAWNTWSAWTQNGSVPTIDSDRVRLSMTGDNQTSGGTATFSALPGDFRVQIDYRSDVAGGENTYNFWIVQIGSQAQMSNTDNKTGVGPGLFICEGNSGTLFNCPGTENNLTAALDGSGLSTNMGGVGMVHSLDLRVDGSNGTYRVFVDGSGPPYTGLSFVDSTINTAALDTIRFGAEQTSNFNYYLDNLVIRLTVANEPQLSLSQTEHRP